VDYELGTRDSGLGTGDSAQPGTGNRELWLLTAALFPVPRSQLPVPTAERLSVE